MGHFGDNNYSTDDPINSVKAVKAASWPLQFTMNTPPCYNIDSRQRTNNRAYLGVNHLYYAIQQAEEIIYNKTETVIIILCMTTGIWRQIRALICPSVHYAIEAGI